MAIRKVVASAVNMIERDDNVLWNLTGVVNTLSALVNQLNTGDELLSVAGLAIGTDKTAVAHDALRFQIDGYRYAAVAGEVAFTATSHDIADIDDDPREAIYVLSVDVAGAVTITKGTTAAKDEAVAPATPAGEVKLGEVLIQHDGTLPFDATTDELDDAHLLVVFTDEALGVLSGVADTLATTHIGTPG
jgi:hypothetical protein